VYLTLAGPDRHLNEQSAHKEIRVSDEEKQNPCDKISRKVENISTESIIRPYPFPRSVTRVTNVTKTGVTGLSRFQQCVLSCSVYKRQLYGDN
jgi:hypothetical protein